MGKIGIVNYAWVCVHVTHKYEEYGEERDEQVMELCELACEEIKRERRYSDVNLGYKRMGLRKSCSSADKNIFLVCYL